MIGNTINVSENGEIVEKRRLRHRLRLAREFAAYELVMFQKSASCCVGKGSIVAAGALVPEGMQIPPKSVVMGVPGKIRREVSAVERERFRENVEHYVLNTRLYQEEKS